MFDRRSIVFALPNNGGNSGRVRKTNNKIVTCSFSFFEVWDARTMELKKELTGMNHWVRALVATQNHLYSGSYQTIKVSHHPPVQWLLSDNQG